MALYYSGLPWTCLPRPGGLFVTTCLLPIVLRLVANLLLGLLNRQEGVVGSCSLVVLDIREASLDELIIRLAHARIAVGNQADDKPSASSRLLSDFATDY